MSRGIASATCKVGVVYKVSLWQASTGGIGVARSVGVSERGLVGKVNRGERG